MTTAQTNPRSSTSNRVDRFQEEPPCALVRLTAGSAWPVPRHVREVKCLAGKIWLTRANDSRDVVLIPGQSIAITGRRAVVQALADAVMRV